MGIISRNKFKCKYLKNEKLSFEIFIVVLKFTSNIEHFEKCFGNYEIQKTCLLNKCPVLERSSRVKVADPKHC